MSPGPILSRELLTAARRRETYRRRGLLAVLVLLFIGMGYLTTYFREWKEFSIREMAALAQIVFGNLVFLQVCLTTSLVPRLVAGVLAEEKERRTLSGVLTTRLSSAEIVLGKLAAGMLQYLACLATGLPIMILLPLLGGIDPRTVLLAYAGTVSTAFFLAGLSILVSTAARRRSVAIGEAVGLATLWLVLPPVWCTS